MEALVKAIRASLGSVVGIYLFGSTARGTDGPSSDLDVAVLAEGPLDPGRVWDLAQDLAVQAGRDVDLVDLRRASTVLRMQVVGHGTRRFCSDAATCARFEDLVFVQYARLNEERREILRDIAARGRVHG